jgi:hypothetical protein
MQKTERLLLGITFFLMGVLPLLNFSAFLKMIAVYDMPKSIQLNMLAVSIIIAGISAGVGIMAGSTHTKHMYARIGLALLLIWELMEVQAKVRGVHVAKSALFGTFLVQNAGIVVIIELAVLIVITLHFIRGKHHK